VGTPADQLPEVNQLPSAAAPVQDVSHVAARTGVELAVTEKPTAAMATANRVSKRIMRLLLRQPILAAPSTDVAPRSKAPSAVKLVSSCLAVKEAIGSSMAAGVDTELREAEWSMPGKLRPEDG
jgi:hypothetical protein